MKVSGDNTIAHKQVDSAIGASGRVVMELMRGVPAGSFVYYDNYFASPLLCLKLKVNINPLGIHTFQTMAKKTAQLFEMSRNSQVTKKRQNQQRNL